ncbi:MAG: peptide-methionine (S)-S-oxide reductase MsrA [Proteobacteria bacterium]|nr:peptide-methionine (S)-S-oxide reductase MsrA [Pseudomonadota bacterium]
MRPSRSLPAGLSAAALLALAGGSQADAQAPARAPAPAAGVATAVFAAGCFWCVEEAFEKVPGVVGAVSGYTGGRAANPTYKQVSAGGTGHYEAVQVRYDPARVSYAQLLDTFWLNVDPLDGGGQFCDRGDSYKGAVFAATPEQRRLAEASKQKVAARLRRPVVTPILAASRFHPAEGYHQNYYKTNNTRYRVYKWKCGRSQRLEALWGKAASKPAR